MVHQLYHGNEWTERTNQIILGANRALRFASKLLQSYQLLLRIPKLNWLRKHLRLQKKEWSILWTHKRKYQTQATNESLTQFTQNKLDDPNGGIRRPCTNLYDAGLQLWRVRILTQVNIGKMRALRVKLNFLRTWKHLELLDKIYGLMANCSRFL